MVEVSRPVNDAVSLGRGCVGGGAAWWCSGCVGHPGAPNAVTQEQDGVLQHETSPRGSSNNGYRNTGWGNWVCKWAQLCRTSRVGAVDGRDQSCAPLTARAHRWRGSHLQTDATLGHGDGLGGLGTWDGARLPGGIASKVAGWDVQGRGGRRSTTQRWRRKAARLSLPVALPVV